MEILNLVSKGIISPPTDLLEIATGTHGMSGADLTALMYSAQLLAIQASSQYNDETDLKSDPDNGDFRLEVVQGTISPQDLEKWRLKLSKTQRTNRIVQNQRVIRPLVTIHHLNEALRSSKPSISIQERLQFKRIFDEFMGLSKPDGPGTRLKFA